MYWKQRLPELALRLLPGIGSRVLNETLQKVKGHSLWMTLLTASNDCTCILLISNSIHAWIADGNSEHYCERIIFCPLIFGMSNAQSLLVWESLTGIINVHMPQIIINDPERNVKSGSPVKLHRKGFKRGHLHLRPVLS